MERGQLPTCLGGAGEARGGCQRFSGLCHSGGKRTRRGGQILCLLRYRKISNPVPRSRAGGGRGRGGPEETRPGEGGFGGFATATSGWREVFSADGAIRRRCRKAGSKSFPSRSRLHLLPAREGTSCSSDHIRLGTPGAGSGNDEGPVPESLDGVAGGMIPLRCQNHANEIARRAFDHLRKPHAGEGSQKTFGLVGKTVPVDQDRLESELAEFLHRILERKF